MKKRFSFINAKYPPKFRDPNSDLKKKTLNLLSEQFFEYKENYWGLISMSQVL